MLSKIFNKIAKLQYPNPKKHILQVLIKDAEGSLIMWSKEDMIFFLIQYFFKYYDIYVHLCRLYNPLDYIEQF
jgi:hypothetical protein